MSAGAPYRPNLPLEAEVARIAADVAALRGRLRRGNVFVLTLLGILSVGLAVTTCNVEANRAALQKHLSDEARCPTEIGE